MAGKDLKRGSEEMNLENETELSSKHPKLSDWALPVGWSQGFSFLLEDEKEKSEAAEKLDDEFVDLSEEFLEKPGGDEDYECVEATMSDDWTAMMWRNNLSDLQVVTKSSYSCDWMKEILKSNIFGYPSDGKAEKLHICRNNKRSVSSRSSVLFCFENDKWDLKLLGEVKDLSSHLGMKKVIILLSEKTPDHRLPGQMKDGGDFPVLNFSRHQVTWYENNLQFYNGKMEKMKRLVKDSAPLKGQKIGIFSRSSESDFEWLKMELESGCFRDAVEDVRSYYISNRGFQQFMTDVSNCSFGILYHTKNRGRINITDVTDSLYDEELQYMSGMLNKEVIVVVDDLQNGNDEEKSRILHSQPTIGEKAKDLFLFTTDEKKFLEPLAKMRNLINGENK